MLLATVIKAAAGIGKTTRVIAKLAKSGRRVEYYAPTHALGEEVKAIFLRENPSLAVTAIAGRSHPGPDGEPLCTKHKIAELIARAGGDVYSSLCQKIRSTKAGETVEECEHYQDCPYIAQFDEADVKIYPHAYLPLRRMALEFEVPDIAVIDESFYTSCIEVKLVPITLLHAPFLEETALRVCAAIEHALLNGLPVLKHMKDVGLTAEECFAARTAIGQGRNISPEMSKAHQKAALPQLRERNLIRALLEGVGWEYYRSRRPESQELVYCPHNQTIKVHTKKQISRFTERTYGAPGKTARITIIDGSADEQIIEQWFPRVKTTVIPAPRNARVVQVSSTRCSTTSLVPDRNSDPASMKAARARLHQLETFIRRLAAQHRKVLVIGPQAITGNPKAKVRPLFRVPSNVDLAHFNAIRGIDKWKDHGALILIGRNEPPIAAVEEIARCVFQEGREPLFFSADWVVEPRGYRMKKGKHGIYVITHPDPRIQAILEQLRERESQQAIDRLRLVHAGTTKAVYILSNLPLDIDVDELVTWDDLMEGTRLERAWNALQGVLPLQPDWLAGRFPQLWKTPDAAKADVRRALKECQFTNNIYISNLTLFKHSYRPARSLAGESRQRAWSVFLSSEPDVERSRVALEGLLGPPVVFRDVRRVEGSSNSEDQPVASPPAIASSSASDIPSSRPSLPRASAESSTLRTSGA